MATEIHKLVKDGKTFLPATTTDAVVHPQVRATMSSLVVDYNVSVLFPTSGEGGGNKYTLDSMITLLGTKLGDQQKVVGVRGSFLDSPNGNLVSYIYTGPSPFSDKSGWTKFDTQVIKELGNNLGRIESTISGLSINGKILVSEEGEVVLGGQDIKLSGYTQLEEGTKDLVPVSTDTVNQGISKLERSILDNEKKNSTDHGKIKSSVGLGDDLSYSPTNPILEGSTSISEGLEKLATKIEGVVPKVEGGVLIFGGLPE